MSGATVRESVGSRVKARQEDGDERAVKAQTAQFVVDGEDGCRGIDGGCGMETDEADDVGEPHSGGQSLACDVSEGKDGLVANVEDGAEIAGDEIDRERFAGDLELTAAKFARPVEEMLKVRCFRDIL